MVCKITSYTFFARSEGFGFSLRAPYWHDSNTSRIEADTSRANESPNDLLATQEFWDIRQDRLDFCGMVEYERDVS
jgi:hypothetical protein